MALLQRQAKRLACLASLLANMSNSSNSILASGSFTAPPAMSPPTSSALKLHEALQRSEGFLSEIYNELSDDQTRPSGQLKINVPMSYGEQYLAKPLADYAARYPDVIVDVDFDDKRVHLIEEGYDAVVRIGVLEDPGLIARHISDFPIELCAAPPFLRS